MSARDVIAKHLCTMAAQGWSEISAFERAAYRTTAIRMVDALTSSGYRILGPDEVDQVTVEKCAEHLEGWGDMYGDNAATAIRALCATHQGDK